MKKYFLFLCLQILGGTAVAADDDTSVLRKAWNAIAGIEGFNIENADPAIFNFPEGLSKGQFASFPDGSVMEKMTTILDGISEDFLLGELSDESFDERVFVEPAGNNKNVMLYTVVGSGDTDALAFISTITDEQADEVAAMWDERMNSEEEDKEEFEQDFGDE